jgi:multimeric flavodoxin WrbA
VIQDSFSEIEQKLKESDGIILSSPVYLRQVSGILKTMIDRTCSHYHRPILVGKPIFSCVTTNASGAKETLKYLKDITVQWGGIPAGYLAVKLGGVEQAVLKKKIDRFCTLLESPKELDRPNWKRIMDFQVQKVLALQVLLQDRPYWENEGWDQRDYFYENQLSWIKKKVGHIFYQFLAGKMKKK